MVGGCRSAPLRAIGCATFKYPFAYYEIISYKRRSGSFLEIAMSTSIPDPRIPDAQIPDVQILDPLALKPADFHILLVLSEAEVARYHGKVNRSYVLVRLRKHVGPVLDQSVRQRECLFGVPLFCTGNV